MAFRDGMRRARVTVRTRFNDVFVDAATGVHQSIVEGDELTGAPGQPVQSGTLKLSWVPRFVSATEFSTSTNVVYAPFIEHGIITARSGQVTGNTQQRLTLRSPVGGFHSVALTVLNFPRIVERAVARAS